MASPPQILTLDDFEAAARRRLPRFLFDYVAGGAQTGAALVGNRKAFDRYGLVPRVLRGVAHRDPSNEVFGHRYAQPFGVAPMGGVVLSAPGGDLALAAAAQAANLPFILSANAYTALEAVLAAAPATWFQMSMSVDEGANARLADRVACAGCETLVVCVDTPVMGAREADVRNGFTQPPRLSLRLVRQALRRPAWCWTVGREVLTKGLPGLPNTQAEGFGPPPAMAALDMSHLRHLRRVWAGRLVVKGVLAASDAIHCVQAGADGLILSNHGGRQLDHAISPLAALPMILDRGLDTVVMIDGGFRRGSDVLKALALGAKQVFLGRPFLWAAATAGYAGVERAIAILAGEIDKDMALMGLSRLDELANEDLGAPWIMAVE